MPTEEFSGRYTGLKEIGKKNKDRLTRLNSSRKRIGKSGKVVSFPVAKAGEIKVVDFSERYPDEVFKTAAFANKANEFKALKNNVPVLMMPVRLETKFYLDQNPPSLKIRIFPDQIMVEDHEERLSVNEYETGKSYWVEHKKLEKAEDAEGLDNLWNWFTSKIGANRAPYVAKQCLKNIPADKLRAGEEYSVSQSHILPDQWLVVGYRNNRRVLEAYSRLIKQDIAFSPDFRNTAIKPDDVSIDPAIDWMFDFDKAVTNGMAVNVTYNPSNDQQEIQNIRDHGFDELYVVGIKLKQSADKTKNLTVANAAKLLEQTLEAHLYSKGAGFVPQGMPTNNTEDTDSGWSAFDPDVQSIRFREFDDINNAKTNVSASQSGDVSGALIPQGVLPAKLAEWDKNYTVLGKALGLSTSSVLKRFEYREGYEHRLQRAMNSALWPVTWGEYFQSLFSHNDTPLLDSEDTGKVEHWFVHNVRGGANIPYIRIGETPYGILPVQSFGAMNPDAITNKVEREIFRILKKLLSLWMGEKDTLLQMTDNPQALNDPGEVFLELLSRFPLPMQFHGQNMYNDDWIINPWYALCKAAITDVSVSENAAFVDEYIQTSLTGLNNKKFSSMDAQWDAYEDLRSEVQTKRNTFDTLNGGIISPAAAAVIKNRFDQYLNAMEPMFDAMSDHSLRGQLYELLDVPHTLSNGSLDPKTPNPQMLYARYRTDVATWPEDQYVIVNRDEETVTPQTYIGYLKLYIDSYLSPNVDMGDAPFPDTQKPLLYHLLFSAISRIVVDNDETAIIFEEIIDNVITGIASKTFDATMKTMDKNKIDLLNNAIGLASKNSTKKEANNIHAVLKHTDAKTLKQVSVKLKALTKDNIKDANYPKKEMQALSKNIDSLIADAKTLDISKKKIIIEKPRQDKLNAFKTHLEFLEKSPWHQLELLMQQSLSLAGWRLDAWFNSFHAAHLNVLRGSQETGIQIGAFGWVHNLKPRESETGTEDVSDGFIHAPSLNHAKTAAVLRAGWNAYKDEEANEALAVDLSSERVRLAGWLFDAVRQGQDLGDVLGYRFERFLHEEKRDHWIMPVRMAVLEITEEEFDPKSPVVDGMELLNIWNNQGAAALFKKAKNHFEGTPPAIGEINAAIWHIDMAVDAMGDAAIAESVHALVQGNAMRAGSSLAAINNGEVLPPELQAIKTQRSGKAFTHRTMMVQTTNRKAYSWFGRAKEFEQNVRALADPETERLVYSLLKDPKNIDFEVAFVNEEGHPKIKKVISLGEVFEDQSFRLSALDVIAMVGEAEDGFSVLEDWILCWMRHTQPESLQDGLIAVILSGDDAEDLNETDKTRMWLSGWRDLIEQSRPLNLDDFKIAGEPEKFEAAKIDIANLEQRAKSTLVYFGQALNAIEAALPIALATEKTPYPAGDMPIDQLQALLLSIAKMNMPSAIPQSAATPQEEVKSLYEQLWQARGALIKRFENLPQINAQSRDIEQRIKTARQIIHGLLGNNFKVSVNIIPENVSAVAASFAKSKNRIGKNAAPVCHEWLEKMQYVEPKIRLLSEAKLVHEMMGKGALGEMVVGQWPDIKGEPWSAQAPQKLSQRSYMSTLACVASGFDIDTLMDGRAYITGLQIHESLEYVPSDEEDTALAMHFDAPNTEAPQTMLLAMAPSGQSWDFDLMIDTLRDTFEWVQLRTIDNVDVLAQHLPAIFANRYLSPGFPPDQEGGD